MNGFADDVNSFDRLPFQCHDGMLVKVANTDSTDEDDFYVVFNGDNGMKMISMLSLMVIMEMMVLVFGKKL